LITLIVDARRPAPRRNGRHDIDNRKT